MNSPEPAQPARRSLLDARRNHSAPRDSLGHISWRADLEDLLDVVFVDFCLEK
jgi:tRNA U34 5-carboxymethylaminomethyl modifying GTPase MnmE/TrmE